MTGARPARARVVSPTTEPATHQRAVHRVVECAQLHVAQLEEHAGELQAQAVISNGVRHGGGTGDPRCVGLGADTQQRTTNDDTRSAYPLRTRRQLLVHRSDTIRLSLMESTHALHTGN